MEAIKVNAMNESILENVRSACNLKSDDDAFDSQLIPLINTYLFRSAQAGFGRKGFSITGDTETWEEFLEDGMDASKYEAIKTYVGLRVHLRFDPPQNSALLTAMKEDAHELEWCLYDEADICGDIQ